jgi:transcriptional regulator with XRE-family HTH domain
MTNTEGGPVRGRQSARKVDGAKVRKLREDAGITLSRFARDLGTDPTHLSRIERDLGQPGLALRKQIAEKLGVAIDELLKQRDLPIAA